MFTKYSLELLNLPQVYKYFKMAPHVKGETKMEDKSDRK